MIAGQKSQFGKESELQSSFLINFFLFLNKETFGTQKNCYEFATIFFISIVCPYIRYY